MTSKSAFWDLKGISAPIKMLLEFAGTENNEITAKPRKTSLPDQERLEWLQEKAQRLVSVKALNEETSSSTRFWSIYRIGNVCRLHILNKQYRVGDNIIGVIDFTNSTISCAKYAVILQCDETQQSVVEQEFSLGLTKNNFMITIPQVANPRSSVIHCELSFLFYIADKSIPKTLFEDKAGTIELGPSILDTKLFSCHFPITIHTEQNMIRRGDATSIASLPAQ